MKTFECERRGSQFVFHCDHCNREHGHGAVEGHRVAHCDDGSPYKDGGYMLKEKPETCDCAWGHVCEGCGPKA